MPFPCGRSTPVGISVRSAFIHCESSKPTEALVPGKFLDRAEDNGRFLASVRDNLRKVLEEAYRPNEIDNQDVFEFCEVVEATGKVQRALRLCGYENTADYVTFEITSWNKPFECDQVEDFNTLEMQEFTVTCDLSFKNVPVRDEDGHIKYNSNGKS